MGTECPETPLTHGCKAMLLIREFSALITGWAPCRCFSYFRNVAQATSRPVGSKPPSRSGSMGDQEWRGHRTDPPCRCEPKHGPPLQPLSPSVRSHFAMETPLGACRSGYVLTQMPPFQRALPCMPYFKFHPSHTLPIPFPCFMSFLLCKTNISCFLSSIPLECRRHEAWFICVFAVSLCLSQ